jgi:hypothetical protein
MHDAAPRYDRNAVVDVPGEPARPRTLTEELTVQIMTNGTWHRRTPDLKSTACGQSFHAQFTPTRLESHKGPLCLVCFTPYEREKSAEIDRAERNGTR